MRGFKDRFVQTWGLWFFTVDFLIGVATMFRAKHGAHYTIFTGGASNLWSGVSPYGTDFGTNLGYYFYSPTCGLFFYGLFSWMPRPLGMFVYMGASAAVFVFGALTFIRACLRLESRSFLPSPKFNWFWFWAGHCTLSSMTAFKLELLIVGLLFLALSFLIEGRRMLWAALILAMITNWKFQPIPLVGLVSLTFMLTDVRSAARFVILFAVSLLFWFALPLLVLNQDVYLQFSREWFVTLNQNIATEWVKFQHVYKVFLSSFGLNLSYRSFQVTSLAAGATIAATVSYWILKARTVLREHRQFALMFSFAWASWYTIGFSPMSQSNAFILSMPLFLSAFVFLELAAKEVLQRSQVFLLRATQIAGVAAILLGSDILGKSSRVFVTESGARVYGLLFLALSLTYFMFSMLKKKERSGVQA